MRKIFNKWPFPFQWRIYENLTHFHPIRVPSTCRWFAWEGVHFRLSPGCLVARANPYFASKSCFANRPRPVHKSAGTVFVWLPTRPAHHICVDIDTVHLEQKCDFISNRRSLRPVRALVRFHKTVLFQKPMPLCPKIYVEFHRAKQGHENTFVLIGRKIIFLLGARKFRWFLLERAGSQLGHG